MANEINQINSEYARTLAQQFDGLDGKVDSCISKENVPLFMQELEKHNDKCSGEDFEQIMGLYRTDIEENSSTELSGKEIGKIALKSAKNFVKGMFCNKDGKFSIGKTALTVGAGAVLCLSAPIAALLGASTAVVSGISAGVTVLGSVLLGAMGIKAGAKVGKGVKDYHNAETKQEAVKAMEETMNGAVELVSIPVFAGFIKAGSKIASLVRPKKVSSGVVDSHQQAPSTEGATGNAQPKKTYELKDGSTVTVKKGYSEVRNPDGTISAKHFNDKLGYGKFKKIEYSYDKYGKLKEETWTYADGKTLKVKMEYNKYGDLVKKVKVYEPGTTATTSTGKTVRYNKGMIVEQSVKNHYNVHVYKDLNGNHIRTTGRHYNGDYYKEFATPDAKGRTKIEKKGHTTIETFAENPNGIKEIKTTYQYKDDGHSYDEIVETLYADGSFGKVTTSGQKPSVRY